MVATRRGNTKEPLMQLDMDGPPNTPIRQPKSKKDKILSPRLKPDGSGSVHAADEDGKASPWTLGCFASLLFVLGGAAVDIHYFRKWFGDWGGKSAGGSGCELSTVQASMAAVYPAIKSFSNIPFVEYDTWFEKSMPHDPVSGCVILCVLCAVVCFVLSTLTGNASQVDKLWSVTPWMYAWICATDDRTYLMALCATVWGVRLSLNFARRGGYQWPPWSGEEDYRWPILRSGKIPYLACLSSAGPWMLFNLVFISTYQHVLLMLTAAPSMWAAAAAHCGTAKPINTLDYVAAGSFLLLVAIETVADNQQFAFQTEKYRRINEGERLTGEYKDGFLSTGLFAWVRKPNYSAEQHIWVAFYLFSVAATGEWVNWSGIGCVLLILLFQGSGWMTELVTVEKYAAYEDYMARVPRYNPILAIFKGN